MSNLIYKDEFYNEYQKIRYLKQSHVEESTKEGYRILFKRSSVLENHLDKDLYNFNSPEIEQLLKLLNPGVANTTSNYTSIINKYIDWALSENLKTFNRLNPTIDFHLNKSFYTNHAATPRDIKLFNYNAIWRGIIQECANAQDAVIVALYFEGASTEEILNLKKNDVYQNSGTLFLKKNRGESRKVIVDEKTINLCNQAADNVPYQKLNGNSTAKAKELKIVESDHVVRSVRTQTKAESKADEHAIYRRLKMLSIQLEFPYLNSTNIRNSGMLKIFRDFYMKANGHVEEQHYYDICELFGMNKSRENMGEMVYNHYPYKSEFLNEETMIKVYGEEVKETDNP